MSNSPAERRPYADQLQKLQAESSSPESVLIAAGHLLRRPLWVGVDRETVERALAGLSLEALSFSLGDGRGHAAALGASRIAACGERMRQAADEAFESALPAVAEESRMWAAAALEALTERDALESARVALEHVAGRQSSALMSSAEASSAEGLSASFRSSLVALDERIRPLVRYFVSLNVERRRERDLLSEPHREAAFWFSQRADCDGLLSWLAGTEEPGDHVLACSECRSDLDASRLPGPDRHVEAPDWIRYESGATSLAQKEWIERHAARCTRCGEVLRLTREIDVDDLAASGATVDS